MPLSFRKYTSRNESGEGEGECHDGLNEAFLRKGRESRTNGEEDLKVTLRCIDPELAAGEFDFCMTDMAL
jgi:hypothetical protein